MQGEVPDPDQLHDQGNLLCSRGRFAEAEACYRQALALQSDRAETANNLAVTLAEQGRHEEALGWYKRALELNDQYADAHYNLGNTLRSLQHWREACRSYERCLALRPDQPSALINLAIARSWLGQVQQTLECYERVLQIDPDNAAAWNGQGLMFQRMGDAAAAERCFDRAVRLEHGLPSPHVNRAQLWLQQGRFREGFAEFQWRWRLPGKSLSAGMPPWNGEPIDGSRMLLWMEQGVGDAIMLLRFAEDVRRAGAYVMLQCPRTLHRLLETCPLIDRLCDGTEADIRADYHAPLFDLPRNLGTTLDSIPVRVPYLSADQDRQQLWRDRLDERPGFKVGVAWQGNRAYPEDCHRSFPLAALQPVADVPGVSLVSLQLGAGREQVSDASLPFSVLDWSDDLDQETPFLDTAALLTQLDLVIVCDTSIGHLAGALGVPAWLALSKASDWRWLTGRADSPWYPHHRLYRQTTLDDWTQPFQAMAADIRGLVNP